LVKQQFATKQAEADFANAKLTREVADLAVKEYVSTDPDKNAKILKELQSEVEKTRSDELAKRATHERHKRDEEAIRAQIERCTIRADIAGVVIHANDPNRAFRAPQIRQGKTVRERQIIFWISDHDGPMQVRVKLREEMVVKVHRGLRAQIMVDALGESRLSGTVASVAPLPDATNLFDDAKVYTTLIAIDKPPPAVRPGMTAQSEILITQLDGVLAVPIEAVLDFEGKDHVAVKKPDGRFEWREVARGVSNGTLVELKKGVRSGDLVALKPLLLWSKQKKP
jgi:multidrug efflux pump subunit AcrA (membrane-fusion protein)